MFDPAAAQAQARAFLPTVPLLEGMSEVEIGELAQIMRRQELPVGQVLWRKGDEVKGMLLIVDGRISVSVPLPGDRVVEVTSLGAGEVLGEVPLLDGGQHSATATVAEPATLLSLSRADFAGARLAPASDGLRAQTPNRPGGLCAPPRPARGPRHLARRRRAPRGAGR